MIEPHEGIGIDLVYIPRIKKLCEIYGEKFLKKVFTDEEISYAQRKKNPYPHLASAFAAKEAFFKALGGYRPFRFREISLIRTERGPKLFLSGRAKEVFELKGRQKILISLSHDADYTIALVLITREREIQ